MFVIPEPEEYYTAATSYGNNSNITVQLYSVVYPLYENRFVSLYDILRC